MIQIQTYDQYVDNLRHQSHTNMSVVCVKCGSDMKLVWSKILKSGNMVGVWKCNDHRFHLKYKVALRLTMKRMYVEYKIKNGCVSHRSGIPIETRDYIVR